MKDPQLWNAREQARFWNIVFAAAALLLVGAGYLIAKLGG